MLERERAWLDAATAEYRGRKQAAQAEVERWEWYAHSARALEPLFFERSKLPRGKALRSKPSAPAIETMAYGLDASDRIVVERRYILRGKFLEQYYAWTPTQVEAVAYDEQRQATLVRRGKLVGGRLVEMVLRSRIGGRRERFEYEGGELVASDT